MVILQAVTSPLVTKSPLVITYWEGPNEAKAALFARVVGRRF